ncbi:MAG TPA: 50S ribosomal protein L10 [Candidatus Kapabacteria bacterium]|nr:50S ribosomal protein L10 [Candidatus Kapabacteria bacterium]
MTREDKVEALQELGNAMKDASSIYFTDYKGLTVAQATELRNAFRKAGATYKVAKNTLIKRALSERGISDDKVSNVLEGQTGLAFGFEDPAAPARVLKEFTEKNEQLKFKLAWLDGSIYDGKQLKTLAALPTKKELIANIIGSLQAPVSGIVGVLGALQRDLVYLMDAIEKKKAEGAAA